MLPAYSAPLDKADRLRLAFVFALPLAFILFTAASLLSSGDLELAKIHTTWSSAYALRFGNGDLQVQHLREPERPFWTEQENELRSYRWKAPEVDQSLQAFVEGLDEVSSDIELQLNAAAFADPFLPHSLSAELATGCSNLAQ